MALHLCPECGHQVSVRAAACPHCGAPIGRARRLRLAIQDDRVAVATELGGFRTVMVYDLIDDTGS